MSAGETTQVAQRIRPVIETQEQDALAQESSMFETLGLVVYDFVRFVRRPGFQYWEHTFEDIWRLLRLTVPLAVFMCFFIGGIISIHAINAINDIGAAKELSGILLASLALRSVSILMVLLSLAASAGAGTVTEFGAMRVNEEIDALESISIDSHSYLIGCRMMAVLIVAPILMVLGTSACFLGGWGVAMLFPDLNLGVYGDFFWRGLVWIDLVYVAVEVLVIAFVGIMVCASQGYRASGGPVGVGLAVGRAMDIVIWVGMLLNLSFSFFYWGTSDTIKM